REPAPPPGSPPAPPPAPPPAARPPPGPRGRLAPRASPARQPWAGSRTLCPGLCAGLRQVVGRVRHLDGSVGVPADQVGELVPEVGDDVVTLAFDVGPHRGLVLDGAAVAGRGSGCPA